MEHVESGTEAKDTFLCIPLNILSRRALSKAILVYYAVALGIEIGLAFAGVIDSKMYWIGVGITIVMVCVSAFLVGQDSPDEDSPDEDSPDEVSPDEVSPDKDNPDEVSPDKDNPDEVSPDEDKDNPDEVSPDEDRDADKSRLDTRYRNRRIWIHFAVQCRLGLILVVVSTVSSIYAVDYPGIPKASGRDSVVFPMQISMMVITLVLTEYVSRALNYFNWRQFYRATLLHKRSEGEEANSN